MTNFFGSSTPFAEPLWYSRGNPNYTKSHERLRQTIRNYVDTEIAPFCTEWEANEEVPKSVLKRHSQLGYTAILTNPSATKEYLRDAQLPGEVSPDEWDSFHDLVAIDEMARCGSLGVLWALGCGNAIGCPPIIHFGTQEQKDKWLPPFLRGDARFCLGVTEPDTGSDVANLSTTAVKNEEQNAFIVNGTKKWVTNGTFADYCTAVVRTGGPGKAGISVLVIPLNLPGVTRTKMKNSGVGSSGCACLTFDNVQVPAENIVGPLNEGFKLVMHSFNHERLWIAGNCLRMARICLEDSYQHALVRETFGRKLIERQSIRLKFANVGMSIMSAYALLESLVQVVRDNNSSSQSADLGTDIGGLCALAKVNAARATELAVREAQQVLGAAGYTRGEGPGQRVERISRDVRILVVGGGSEEILVEMAVMQERKDLERLRVAKQEEEKNENRDGHAG